MLVYGLRKNSNSENYLFSKKTLIFIACKYFSYKRILVLISHSQDFLNGVCTNIIHVNKKRLKYYTGNYDAFVRTRMELLENQMKQYNWEQDQINHMKVKSSNIYYYCHYYFLF